MITCPACGHRTEETMPVDACVYFWSCPGCSAVIRPKHGDCCVFCSYGAAPCPPKTMGSRAE
ncbi:MAG: GDCCVxC domain-containing (seleno)protein [Gemmatimonadales bacterium]